MDYFSKTNKKVLGIIPARYNSTRFPGKPLCNINGKSMLQRVYEQALKANSLYDVCIATDDERIINHATNFGAKVFLTSSNHLSGTERCYEACEIYLSQNKLVKIYGVVNIQCDEPFIEPSLIDEISETLKNNKKFQIVTAIKKFSENEDIFDKNSVKVVISKTNKALYFSRSVIPFLRNFPSETWKEYNTYYKHIGIYGYRFDILKKIVKLPVSPCEIAENLEQLRWLENDFSIHAIITDYQSISIDTYDDLEKIINSKIN